MPGPNVSKIDNVLPLAPGVERSTAPADLDAAIAAAPYCWAAEVQAGAREWPYGPKRDLETVRAIAARPTATNWRHLLSVRVDLVHDDGGGCTIPWEWLKRLPEQPVQAVLSAWVNAGYTIRLGCEEADGRVSSNHNWIQQAMANKGPGNQLAYYIKSEERDGQKILWLYACGIDLAIPAARAWLASELVRHRSAARTVYGTPTDILVPIKTGQLCTPGYITHPVIDPWPKYLIGGYYTPAMLAAYHTEIFAPLGPQSVVINEQPDSFVRGALWGGNVPSTVIGDGVFAN